MLTKLVSPKKDGLRTAWPTHERCKASRVMRHGYIAWGEWHTVVAKTTTVFNDHPLPNVQTIGHAGVFLFFTFGIFLFFSSVQSTTHMSMHKNEGSVLQECWLGFVSSHPSVLVRQECVGGSRIYVISGFLISEVSRLTLDPIFICYLASQYWLISFL